MKSQIFYTDTHKKIENRVKNFLNKYPDLLSKHTVKSTRAAGDAIQDVLLENFQDLASKIIKRYSIEVTRRAMADIAFTDKQDFYYAVDVKTHRLEGTEFSMPNLVSVERLARFYEDDKNYYVILMIAYKVVSDFRIKVGKVYFVPIEFLSWQCLTIGALGWGQIQIANANNIVVCEGYSRKKWMLELCDKLLEFYPFEIEKINERINYFKDLRKRWEQKIDIWEK